MDFNNQPFFAIVYFVLRRWNENMSVFHEIPIEKKERYKELKAKKSRLEARKIDFEDIDEYKQLKDEMYFDVSTLKKGYRNLEEFKQHKSYQYALSVRNGEIPVGKYVKK